MRLSDLSNRTEFVKGGNLACPFLSIAPPPPPLLALPPQPGPCTGLRIPEALTAHSSGLNTWPLSLAKNNVGRMTVHILRSWSRSAPSREEPSVATHSLMKQLKSLRLTLQSFTAWPHLPLQPHPQGPCGEAQSN